MNPLMKLFIRLHTNIFRYTRGRVGSKMAGGRLLLLTTTGRKTGQRRTVPVMYIEDESGRPIVTASAAGAPEHPAWFNNLVANPDVRYQTGEREIPARAEVLTGEARTKAWTELTSRFKNFSAYQKKTTREIPMVVLRPH